MLPLNLLKILQVKMKPRANNHKLKNPNLKSKVHPSQNKKNNQNKKSQKKKK